MATRHKKRSRGVPPAPLLLALAFVAVGAWVVLRSAGPADVQAPEWVEQQYLTENPWSRPGDKLKNVRGVVIHYVGNPGTSAQANRNYFESLSTGEENTFASAHFVVGLEGEVIQCIPLTEIAYASNGRNDDTVAVEVCHPDESGQFSGVTYGRVVELTAYLCDAFHLKPNEDVIRHYDVTGKICPKYYVDHEDDWTQFLSDVEARLNEGFEKED